MGKFVLTAELAVRNQNLRPVISQLQKQLSNVRANVSLKLDPSTKGNLDNINKALALTDSRLKSAAGAAVVLNQQISQLNKTLGGNLNALGKITQTAQKNQQAMNKTAKAANQAASGMTRLGQQSSFAIKRIASFSVATTAVITLTAAMKSGIQEAILFQHGLVKISQITGTSVKNLDGLTSEITRLSTTLGVSSQELLGVSDTLAQAGLSAQEVTVALEALAKTKLAPTFGKIEDTVEGVIASMRQFKIEAADLEATLGSFNSVAAAFAVESNDIVTAVRRSGSAFQAAGGNLNEFIALFTSVRQTTRESAETIATGFRTIFTRIQRPKTLNFLRDLGVELLDLQGRFVGPYEAVRRLSSALAEIPGNDPRFAQIIEELGGFRQVSKVIPLIQQFAVAEKALAVAQRGRGSLTRDAVTAQESLLVQLTKLRERFFELFRTIGDNSSIRGFLQLGLKLGDSLVTIGQALTPLIPLFATLGAIKLGTGLKNFSSGFFGGKAVTGAGKGTTATNTANVAQGVSAAQTNNANAIGANTAAINKLTAILSTLPSAFSPRISSGLGGYAGTNGPVRKFARGGIVPGTGNGDTVNARLMPGEFVMPKGSVENIGAENLAQMARGGHVKKFALGGKITEKQAIGNALSRERQDFGLISLFPQGDPVDPAEERIITRPKLSQELKELTGFGLPTDKESLKNVYPRGFSYRLHSGSIGTEFANNFENSITEQLSLTIDNQAQSLANNLGASLNPNKVDVKKFNFEQISGNIFEAAVSSLDNPFVDKTSSSDAFDYLGGINAKLATKVFGSPELASMPTDAKRTITAKTRAGVDSKVAQIIAANSVFNKLDLMDDVSKSQLEKIRDGKTSKGTDIRQALRTQANKFGILKLPTVPDGVDSGAFHRGLAEKLLRRERFADGGEAIGTDSIPALLTPGEYIFDEPSAKRIGYGNLEKMRAQRYAKGGLVKRFSTGGKLPAPTSATASDGNSGVSKFAPLLFVVPQLASQFGGLSDEITKLSTEFLTIVTIAGLTGKSLGGFKESSDKSKQINDKYLKSAKNLNRSASRGNSPSDSFVKARTDLEDFQFGKKGRRLEELEFNRNNIRQGIKKGSNKAKTAGKELLALRDEKQQLKNVYQSTENEDIQTRNRIKERSERNNQRRANIVNSRNSQNRLAKFEQGAGIAGGVAAGAGVVASLAGDRFLSAPANANIAAGKGTAADVQNAGLGGGISGAGTGAGIGAALGSFLGPLGTLGGAAVGAAIGGLFGFSDATKEATEKLKTVAISKDFDELDKSLNRVSNNKTLSSFDKSTVGNQIAQTRANILEASGPARQEALSRGQNQLPGLTTFADKLATSVKSIDEFKTASGGLGQSLISSISLLSELPLVEVEKQFESTIKAQQNSANIQKKINGALQQIYEDSKYITNVVRAFDDSSNSLQKFVNKANVLANDFQNISFDADITDVLSKGLEANPADLNRVISQLLGPSGQGIANRASSSVAASRQLPDILRAAAAAGPLSDTDPNNATNGFSDAVDAAMSGFPEEFKAVVNAKLGQFLADDSGDTKFLEAVQENADKFAKELSEGSEEFISSLSEAAQTAKKNADALIGIIQQRNAIEQKVIELRANAADTRAKAVRQQGLIGTNRFNSDTSSNEEQAFFNQGQNIRLQGTGLDSSASAGQLSNAMTNIKNDLLELRDQRNTVGVNTPEFESLSNQIGHSESALQKLNGALQQQANSTEVLTALQRELATEEDNRKKKLSLATNLAFGGREGRKEFAQSAQNARAIAARPDRIGSAEQEGSALKFLDQVIELGAGDKQLGTLGGKSANQVKQERLGAFVGGEDAKLLINASNAEKTLQAKVVAAQLGMADAQDKLSQQEQQKLEIINNTLISGFASMRTSFEASMADAEAKRTSTAAQKDKLSLSTVENKIAQKEKLKQDLNAIGLKDDDAEQLSNNAGAIETLKKQRQIRTDLGTVKNRNLVDKTKPVDGQVQDVLNKTFSDKVSQDVLQSEIDRVKSRIQAPISEYTVTRGKKGPTRRRAPTEEEKAQRLQKSAEEIADRYIQSNLSFENSNLLPAATSGGISTDSVNKFLALPEDQQGATLKRAKDVGTVKDSDLAEQKSLAEDKYVISSAAAAQASLRQRTTARASTAAQAAINQPITRVAVPARPVATTSVAVPASVPAVPTSVASTAAARPAPLSNAEYSKLTPAQKAARKEQQDRYKAAQGQSSVPAVPTSTVVPASVPATSITSTRPVNAANQAFADKKAEVAKMRADYAKNGLVKPRALTNEEYSKLTPEQKEARKQQQDRYKAQKPTTTPSTLQGTFEERRAKQIAAIEQQKKNSAANVKTGQDALNSYDDPNLARKYRVKLPEATVAPPVNAGAAMQTMSTKERALAARNATSQQNKEKALAVTSPSKELGQSIINGFTDGAKQITSVFDSLAKTIPQSIDLIANFQPLQINVTGMELGGMAEIIGPILLAKIQDQFSKVIPGLKTLTGPGQMQKPTALA